MDKKRIEKEWFDLLCSDCYSILRKGVEMLEIEGDNSPLDEGEYCEVCDTWVFPIGVHKREFRRDVVAEIDGVEDISHGIEIVELTGTNTISNADML